MKINLDKCSVDKRSLNFDCSIREKNYNFRYDGWDDDVESFTVDKIRNDGGIITVYKHCLQAWFSTDSDEKVFIDRRYEHNYGYDVYFAGKHYLVNLSEQDKQV